MFCKLFCKRMDFFKTKKVKITRSFVVYDGPKLPYIVNDSESTNIAFVADGNLLECLESTDYDDWKSAVLDGYPLTDAIEHALSMHDEGHLYELKEDYDFDDYEGCVIGDVYFESDLNDDYPNTNKIVQFEIIKKQTNDDEDEN